MDANRTRFWMLADQRDWKLDAGSNLQYDLPRRCLRLARQRSLETVDDDPFGESSPAARAEAEARLHRVPQTSDRYGGRAYWDDNAQAVMATHQPPGGQARGPGGQIAPMPIYEPAADQAPTGLAMGYDGVLYIAIAGGVQMLDRRGRWNPVRVAAEGFSARRLAAEPSGGVWVLDTAASRLARVQGQPLPDRPHGAYAPEAFRPEPENPGPPRLTVIDTARWPDGETPVAIASSPQGRLAALSWLGDGEARVRCLGSGARWDDPTELAGSRHPYSLAWASDSQVAVLLTGFPREAPVYPIEAGHRVLPVGDFYPLRDHNGGPFLNGLALPPGYPTTAGTSPLHPLSLTSYAHEGSSTGTSPLDSGRAQTAWHRLYLEAHIPPHCGIAIHLAATDDRAEPEAEDDWHEHRFGESFSPALSGNGKNGTQGRDTRLPHGAWMSYPSEMPHQRGLLACDRQAHRSGLFTVLIQRSNRRVRTLRGRYLHVRVRLVGDGRATPELWALRAYAPRFSYRDHYLPPLYREALFGAEADKVTAEPATGPDFLERFLDNFEGVLTPIEDRIAHAHLLTDPRTVPDESLAWLAGWIGLGFDPAYPLERRRALLNSAPELFRRRGTYDGLRLALNVCTGGAVDGGEIVIVEDFRLRRTFATVLGADLADEDDPLLGGLVASGNSYFGDTLFLGDENRKEFLALFAADLDKDQAEEAAVAAFLDRLSHRVTVLVHQDVAPQDLGLIRRVVELDTPAHVLVKVVTASQRFLVAVASLVGVDTYLAHPEQVQAVQADRSHVGVRDRILRPASLDPRMEFI